MPRSRSQRDIRLALPVGFLCASLVWAGSAAAQGLDLKRETPGGAAFSCPPFDPRTDMTEEEVVRMAGQFYKLYLHPRFLARQLAQARSLEDLDYMARGARAIWGHLADFAKIRR